MRTYSIVLWLLIAGCGTRDYKVTKTAPGPFASKPPTCDFVLATTKVDHPYEEIAILDPKDYAAADASEFKEAVRADVCTLGGDAVFAEVSGTGRYIRATVLRWTDAK